MFGIEDFSKPIIDYSNFDFSQIKDVLIFGGSILLIGMATIFAVLIILWAFLALFKLVFHNSGKKEAKKSQKAVVGGIDNAPTRKRKCRADPQCGKRSRVESGGYHRRRKETGTDSFGKHQESVRCRDSKLSRRG